jgi:hypothetical protein
MGYVWPADREGNHQTMDCYWPATTDAQRGNFPKATSFQKLKVGGSELEENQMDLDTEGSDYKGLRDIVSKGSRTSGDWSQGSVGSSESSQ